MFELLKESLSWSDDYHELDGWQAVVRLPKGYVEKEKEIETEWSLW